MRRSTRRRARVAIIGAGLSGIAVAVNLQRRGVTDFVILEREAGPGGTWWRNRYPGCEVDVPSSIYSYSFFAYPWSRTHARQAELQRYVAAAIDRFALSDRVRYDADVRSVVWNEEPAHYSVTLADGVTETFDAVVSCVGLFNVPNIPAWAADFGGKVLHTTEWDPNLDLDGQAVAVVGTGSTACQVVPQLASRASKLYVYQREPGYVLPKRTRDFTQLEIDQYMKRPLRRRFARLKLFYRSNRSIKAYDPQSAEQERIVRYFKRYLERSVESAELRTVLTPSYPYGCKRPIFADDYYPTFNRPNVELVPKPVVAATRQGLSDASGVERPCDIVVLATGFRTTDYLSSFEVVGEGGISLRDFWNGEPSAFVGVTVPRFPNFFILYGPNTNGGGAVLAQIESQAQLVARAIAKIRPAVRIETSQKAADTYGQWVQDALVRRRPGMLAGCHSYYYSATGRNVTQWPYNQFVYWAVARFVGPIGLRRRRTRKSVASGGRSRSMSSS